MKKLYFLVVLIVAFAKPLTAQTLVENHFDGYLGTPSTVPAGWYISWNADTSQPTLSYYTTAGNCGLTCPSYKFGIDSAYIVSPPFVNADTIRFLLKGNGTAVVENTLEIYTSSDSANWTLTASIDSISASATTMSVAIPTTATHVALLFDKPTLGYNAGIDDIYIHRGAFVTNVKSNDKLSASFRPNPVSSKVTFDFGSVLPSATISIVNILGKEVMTSVMNQAAASYSMNLSALEEGIYFVRIQSKSQTLTKRLVVKH